MDTKKRKNEVEHNSSVFFSKLNSGELDDNIGFYALMRKGQIIEYYSTKDDARKTGNKFYEDGIFSVQKVEKKNIDLGYYSHALL